MLSHSGYAPSHLTVTNSEASQHIILNRVNLRREEHSHDESMGVGVEFDGGFHLQCSSPLDFPTITLGVWIFLEPGDQVGYSKYVCYLRS